MTTCLRCSFQASPLLVFWEPRCLPTMAWLIQQPGFLAWCAGRMALFRGEHGREGWHSREEHSFRVSPGRAHARGLCSQSGVFRWGMVSLSHLKVSWALCWSERI